MGESAEKYVTLKWNPNPEPDIAGYHLWRSETETGKYEKLTGENPLPPSENPEYQDASIIPGKSFWYCITAIDTSGNMSNRSKPVGSLALKVDQAEVEK